MEFFLTYKGSLKSNGGIREKARIRQHFHRQLSKLWEQKPLSDYGHYVGRAHATDRAGTISYDPMSIIEAIGSHYFAPLVSAKLYLLCNLDIIMLRVEPPGRLVSGGDIDNRLKTLLDALSMPASIEGIPKGEAPTSPTDPLFCLLQDDNLIGSVRVRSDRLLDYDAQSEVALLIHVGVRATRPTLGNLGIAS